MNVTLQFKSASFFLQHACLYATVRWNSLMDQTLLSTDNISLKNIIEECKENSVPLTTVSLANVQLQQFITMEDRMYAFFCFTILFFIKVFVKYLYIYKYI